MTHLPPLPWIALGAATTLAVQWLMRMKRRRLRAYNEFQSPRRGSNPPTPGAKPQATKSPPPPGAEPPAFKGPFPGEIILPTLPARRPTGGRLIRGDRDPGRP